MDKTTYINGDLVKYTGKVTREYGADWYEVEYLEGHLKGTTRVTSKKPGEVLSEVQKERVGR